MDLFKYYKNTNLEIQRIIVQINSNCWHLVLISNVNLGGIKFNLVNSKIKYVILQACTLLKKLSKLFCNF